MRILDRIKAKIWGTADLAPKTPGTDPLQEAYLGTDQATTGVVPELETPEGDNVARPAATRRARTASAKGQRNQSPDPTAGTPNA